jgi:minor extracellular serine protease Vpr
MFNNINKFRFALALIIVAALTIVIYKAGSTQASTTAAMVSVIVELRDDPAAVYKAKSQKTGQTISDTALQAYRDQLKAAQNQFLKDAQSAGVNAQVRSVTIPDYSGNPAATIEYRYTLVYDGLAMNVPAASISTLASLPEVKAVHMSHPLHISLDSAVPYINAPAVYGKNPNDLTAFASYPDGNEGQGINIAVIDTGIDWTNPMFGGDPTPPRLGVAPPTAAVNTNQKVIYYLPLAGLYDDFGHGSHCAGDAAGYLTVAPGPGQLATTSGGVKIHGVAPQAKLMVYKAGTAVGLVLSEDGILSLEDAVSPVSLTMQPKPIANVINLSFGGGSSPDDPNAVAADNATLMGAVVVAAAGNTGPGDSTIGAPASGRHVIAAGATLHPGAGVNTADVTDGSRTGMEAGVMQGSPLVANDITQNYVYCGLGETPADFPSSVSGKIALIQRGSTVTTPTLPAAGSLGTGLFTTKAANAAAAGAVAALIYNNVDGELNAATVRKSAIPTLGLSKANGEYLVSILGSSSSGAVSAKQVRVNKALQFSPDIASFSSRGPVDGLGQIKPDVAAPGVHIYSATVRVGGAETNTTSMFDPSGFIAGDGTSFASPLTAGAAALILRAHPDWSPDIVRTVLINTATNMRDAQGNPKSDGLSADRIMDQGGGLIDVYRAINARTLMGVTGDGIRDPSILGSYSYGAVPVINSRVSHTETVTVTMQNVSGQGGSYNLSVANNRELQTNGIGATLSNASVSVPANGNATFSVNVTVDGNIIRDTSNPLQVQFYVVAQGQDPKDNLHMPFYMKLTPTVPSGGSTLAPINDSGTILVGDNNSMLVEGVDSQSFPVVADAPGAALNVDLTGDQVAAGTFPDLDLYLFGPDGKQITSSNNGGLPEHISRTLGPAGTYTLRVSGFVNVNTNFNLTGTISKAAQPPTLKAIAGEFVDNQGQTVDFDGNYSLQWQAIGNAQEYEIEQSTDGSNFTVLADVDASATSQALANQADGMHYYRVRALTPGQIGYYITPASNVQNILVNHRALVDITNQVKTAISNVSLTGGVFSMDLAMTNQSASAYVPLVSLNVIGISSTSGSVRVSNADNGGSGVTASNAALFDYSNKLGSDQLFSPAETTATRTLKFADSASELFQFDIDVTAFLANSNGGGGSSAAPSGGGSQSSPSQNGLSLPGINLQSVKGVMRFTVNPLTGGVAAQFVLK